MDVSPKPPTNAEASAPSAEGGFLADESRFADTFRTDAPLAWWVTLVGPFVMSALMLAYAAMDRGVEFMVKLLGNVAFTFFVLGRFAILAAGDASAADTALRLTRFEAFVMVTWMDMFVACMLIFHGGLMFRIPKLGPRLAALREDAEFVLHEHPWMRRFTFIGLSVFVAFPIAATGSVAGSIFARLLGLTRVSGFLAICAGSVLGNALMFVGNKALSKTPFFDPESPLNLVLGLGLILGVVVLLNIRYQRMKRRWAEGTRRGPGRDGPSVSKNAA
ncbi:MAG: hypothetical protein HBSAPP03_21050 [Phycisphaerae bacterium]|nr:MAG: hypothetical protein HBSAPP03_21050 [Phycisphaerae bacterium]